FTRLVTCRVGFGRRNDDHGRFVLRRTRRDDAARRWALRISASGIQPRHWFSFWLVTLSRGADWNDCRSGSCLRQLHWRFDPRDRCEELHHRAASLAFNSQWVRDQSFNCPTPRGRNDSRAHTHKHARLKDWQVHPEHLTFTKTAALIGLIVVGLLLGWNH